MRDDMGELGIEVRVVCERLRGGVNHWLVAHHGEVERLAAAELERLLSDGSVVGLVADAVRSQARHLIEDAVRRALLDEDQVRAMTAAVASGLRGVILQGPCEGVAPLETVVALPARQRDQRDPLCWPCFRERNRADGLDEHAEREDAYVSSCDACGHDHGE